MKGELCSDMIEIILNGENLEVEHAENIKKFDTVISISEESWAKIEKSRAVIEDMLDRGQTIYGYLHGPKWK